MTTINDLITHAMRLEAVRMEISLIAGEPEAAAAYARAEEQAKSSPFSFLQLLERERTLIFNRLNG